MKQNTFTRLLLVGLGGLVLSARAAIPVDFVALESIVVPKGTSLDVGTEPTAATKVYVDVIIGDAQKTMTNVVTRLVTFDQSARCFGVRVTRGFDSPRLKPCIKVSSGDFGLYDETQTAFFPLVPPKDEKSAMVVEDPETLNGVFIAPGQVLKHNHRYLVTEDRTVDATSMPGVSAIRVPNGAAAIIDIAEGKTLTVKGGPGFGRLPGGAGIEVPHGAKLVITGKQGSKLVVQGGAAAAGGKGYGGMGGQFTFFQMTGELDPKHWPYEDFDPASYSDITNNNVAASSFAKDPLYFGLTGDGGDGGDGGGGAGAGIGTRGGPGGLGGKGPKATFVTGGKFYEKQEDKSRYDNYATFFGLDKSEWYIYNDDGDITHNGRNGFAGENGQPAATCGEIVITGLVTVEATAGAAGEGGENGPFGACAQVNETTYGDPSAFIDALNFIGTSAGAVGTVLGTFASEGLVADIASVLGVGNCGIAVGLLVLQAINGDDSVLETQLWFAGGGGGGGGAGGFGSVGIGAGGAGAGAGGAGGEGFFQRGVKSLYTFTGSWLSWKVDGTTPPLAVSGHGGLGGKGAASGKDASSRNRGEPDTRAKDGGNTFNYLQTPGGDWRFGADSWHNGAEAFCGLGGAGGSQADVNTNRFSFLRGESAKVSGYDKNVVTPEMLNGDKDVYTVVYHSGDGADEQEGELICGTIVERAPVAEDKIGGRYFAGYYTEADGKGTQYFDAYLNPVGAPKALGDLELYAYWVTEGKEPKGFTDTVNGSTLKTGDTLLDGHIYYFDTNCDFVNTDYEAGLKVEEGGTAVIYIEKGVTVTCTGSKSYAKVESYPGIYVPESSTLIVTGEGTLIATGGPASNGSSGSVGYSHANSKVDEGESRGGSGGLGGNGGAAGIGGKSGVGAICGDCKRVTKKWVGSGWGCDGASGEDGDNGGDGEASGSVYLLGKVTVKAYGGAAGQGGAAGKSSEISRSEGSTYWLNVGRSGGGGAGAGGSAGHCIGGGGGGGGGGGAGGGGSIIWDRDEYFYADGGVGGGGKSKDNVADGAPRDPTLGGSVSDYSGTYRGGDGGKGGSYGADGQDGSLYISDSVILNAEVFSERGNDFAYSFGHPALGRTIKILHEDAEDSVPAMIGCPLPVLPDRLIRPSPGVVLQGAYVYDELSGELNTNDCWYAEKGAPAITQYAGLESVTLKVVYKLDTERMAATPQVFNFSYDGENHVAYDDESFPGSTYLCGVTNATETGVYSYSVRLDDDYTIWSDLATNRVKTIGWEVTRGAITNEWKNNVLTYDWTKSRADNIYAITNNLTHTLGFELPEDAKVSIELGEQTQVNEQRLIVKVTDMKNYFDRTFYGVFSCEQPFQLLMRSHYPWAAKLDILTMLSSVKIEEKDMAKFKAAYGNMKILAYIYVPDGKGGTKEICLNADTAATVYDALNSGSRTACVTVDLKTIPELEGVRAYSLPVYVSLDGQIFQGGSTTVDTTATLTNGYPLYTVADISDIFDIACSTTFVGGEDKNNKNGSIADHTLLAIGTEEQPGHPFVPRTASGNRITDDCVRWKPTRVGAYRLEHQVVDSAETERLGYRRAYFNLTGSDPEPDPSALVRVKIERKMTGETKEYTSLAAAVADLRYGDTVVIVEDVQMEQVKVPSGTRVRVEGDGVFRSPQEGDFTSDYIAADTVIDSNGKLVSAAYRLDDEKVSPVVVAAKVVDEEAGRAFEMKVDNMKGDLFYLMSGSTNLVSWSLREKFFANGQSGAVDLITPATDARGFFKLAVTDEPTPKFDMAKVVNGVSVTGSDAFTTGAPFAGHLVIPSTIEGESVKEVGENAFQLRTDITSVDLAEGITVICGGAFGYCSNLSSLSLPESLVTVEKDALSNTGLKELVVPKNVVVFKYQDLLGLKSLRFLGKPSIVGNQMLSSDCVVYVPQDAGWEGVPSTNWNGARLEYWVDFRLERDDAGNFVVIGCDRVPADGRLWIPAERDGRQIAAIKYEAFRDRKDITKLVVAEGVSDVGGGSFLGCTNLTEVEFPKSLTHLGRNVFGDKSSKSNVSKLTFLGDSPSYDADLGLDGDKCTIYVCAEAKGWGATWQGCKVMKR